MSVRAKSEFLFVHCHQPAERRMLLAQNVQINEVLLAAALSQCKELHGGKIIQMSDATAKVSPQPRLSQKAIRILKEADACAVDAAVECRGRRLVAGEADAAGPQVFGEPKRLVEPVGRKPVKVLREPVAEPKRNRRAAAE